ncbi:DUF3306 domain-containing protein [Methylobacterium gregans]|uniref:DUF3306 domain-containing protein n=1 Tax=Methylobacterium gregans TaxID=374424 RepID=A0AA37HQF1_9HYPH|nr:DUF3306 domain-containing protein [Methylobacterium gregans]MDQ0523131.1 hypothetical protein [Methylobacterium gregans]GJD79745.1 hypothetical protein NBEOAGPD_2974 [Methylobacterium gregans]GLS56986.1 hypothetical protein GCM10007886_51720 [Methylobacterium gregans]
MSDGFLSRWTRRKRAVRAAERATDRGLEPSANAAVGEDTAAAAGAAERDDSEGIVNAASAPPEAAAKRVAGDPAEPADPVPELPDLNALTRESDLTPFLRAGVPAALRNAALRRMWSIDPAIRDFVSEAREYAYDWNSPGGVPGLGPLLPSDDVQAMLRKIVGGLPAEAAEPAADESPSPPEAVDPDAAIVPDAEPPTEEPGRPTLVVQASVQASPLPDAPPSPASAEIEPITPAPQRASDSAAAPGPRLRRHGGAKPA